MQDYSIHISQEYQNYRNKMSGDPHFRCPSSDQTEPPPQCSHPASGSRDAVTSCAGETQVCLHSVYQIKHSHIREHFHSGSKHLFIDLPQQKLTSLQLFISHSLYLPSHVLTCTCSMYVPLLSELTCEKVQYLQTLSLTRFAVPTTYYCINVLH